MEVSTVKDQEGNEIPSLTQSYFVWKQHFDALNMPLKAIKKDGVCTFCGGNQEVVTKQYGRMWCACKIESRTNILRMITAEYKSIGIVGATLDNFKIWGEWNKQVDQLIIMLDLVKEWVEFPNSWLKIEGPPGTGKSHILSAINRIFEPWSLYINSMDLENKAYKTMRSNGTNLNDMLDTVSQVPILLFDDLGSEYGKEFIVSLVRYIIDFRYQRPTEYITVVASNFDVGELYRGFDPRISDRIHDTNITKIINLEHVSSWRTDNHDK